MFFEGGASQVGAKIGPRSTLEAFGHHFVTLGFVLGWMLFSKVHFRQKVESKLPNFWDLGLTRETLAKAKVPS